MRHELQALQIWQGLPSVFMTLNPADTRHPFLFLFGSHASSEWLPCHTDDQLFRALSRVQLAERVASDPVGVARAFNAHVRFFFLDLLHCCSTPLPDNIASLDGGGLLGPISAYYAITEPQMRGSLHVHMLLHLYAFTSPEKFLSSVADELPQLTERLLQWTSSIISTSLESVPRSLHCPDLAELFQTLQPLPYSKAHKKVLQQQVARQWDFDFASEHWFCTTSTPVPASPPWFDPFADETSQRPSFLPWPRSYLTSTDLTFDAWGKLLLFDLRHSIVHCCLHECRPRTCFKGTLGRLGYCRLGYWFWDDVSSSTRPNTWQRCHGLPLILQPTIGSIPPQEGLFLTERHHPFHTRFNLGLLPSVKCNHDINVLLQAPTVLEADDRKRFADAMATSVRTATYYVTSYMSKVQPHISNLWQLLARGHAQLEQELRDRAQEPDAVVPPSYIAKRVLTRMLMTCQKRTHKSMPEICHYILGYPEAYTSHVFQRLFLTNLLRRAQLLLPHLHPTASPPEATTLLQTQPAHDSDFTPSTFSPQELDYMYRGPSLKTFPFYFYVAAVSRVTTRSLSANMMCSPFLQSHPDAFRLLQHVRLKNAWFVPRLVGPRLPDITADPELRALWLLLLFKPWSATDLSDLLHPCTPTHPATSFPTWTSALDDFMIYLNATAPDCTRRPAPFTPPYWAHRFLLALEHFFFPSCFSHLLLLLRHTGPSCQYHRALRCHHQQQPTLRPFQPWGSSWTTWCPRIFQSPPATYRRFRR